MLKGALSPFRINVVAHRGAARSEAFPQDSPNGPMETPDFGVRQTARRAIGPDTGAKKALIGINIPQAGDVLLTQKQGFDGAAAALTDFT